MFALKKRPLILSPAGSPEALYAALESGADEIYFGFALHNARQNAKNFTYEQAQAAIKACRLRGVKTNITLNTLVTDREIYESCKLAYDALCMGADAFIVQDLGLARALKKSIPEIVIHASTQCACHSKQGAQTLAELGFSRIVLARELSAEEIKSIVSLGIETEIFVHGALCVCHSGMCLMSSVIGKRSGNRGLCAQPCRLPYNFDGRKATEGISGYPLSLKDLSLAKHVPEISELGVTSLKIEGRMKPPEYVSGVTDIWKRLVTENRNADKEEYEYLEKLFSRSGFTDGYFTEKYKTDNRAMYGIRTESDKMQAKSVTANVSGLVTKRKISAECTVCEGQAPVLVLKCEEAQCTVTADFIAQTAKERPMTVEDINSSLLKFGDTHFVCTGIQTEIKGNVFVPKSLLNALRRKATAELEEKILEKTGQPEFYREVLEPIKSEKTSEVPEVRLFPTGLDSLKMMEREYGHYKTESICLPLEVFTHSGENALAEYVKKSGKVFGVRLPRVVFTSEEENVKRVLGKAKSEGASYAIAENIGHVSLIKDSGLDLYTGNYMNVFNSYTVKELAQMGCKSVTLSPELLSAQMRDINKAGIKTAVHAEGRLELMVLESCVVRASGKPCTKADTKECCSYLTDRTGTSFPIKCQRRFGENPYPGRNIILNSVPVHKFSKPEELAKTRADVYCITE